MGYMRHHAIIVSSPIPEKLMMAHQQAADIFPWVSAISPPAMNAEQSFFIPTDGSKEGWEESDEGDSRRDAMVEWLRGQYHEDGSSSLDWAEVQYADDNGENLVTRSSDMDYDAAQGGGEG